jgi:phosphoglycerate dehydrogenase-like enzyme
MNIVIGASASYSSEPGAARAFEEEARRIAEGHVLTVVPPGGDLISAAAGAEVFFPLASVMVTPEFVAAAPRLQWIQMASAGVERAMFPALAERPITLTNAAGVYGIPIAEHTLAMMLALSRRLPELILAQQRHEWESADAGELFDSTVVVVGLGGIGREVARRCRCLGMRVLATRMHPTNPDPDADRVAGADALPGLLPEADWLILCAPATSASRHMIGATELAAMKPSARLINIARGSLVDQPALAAALQSGALAGAGLDVFETEPLPADSPLWDMPNVIVSPHTSGASPRSLERTLRLFLENLRRYLAGEPLENVVDKSEGY